MPGRPQMILEEPGAEAEVIQAQANQTAPDLPGDSKRPEGVLLDTKGREMYCQT